MIPWTLVALAALALFAAGLCLGLGFWCGLGFGLTRADRKTFGTAPARGAEQEKPDET